MRSLILFLLLSSTAMADVTLNIGASDWWWSNDTVQTTPIFLVDECNGTIYGAQGDAEDSGVQPSFDIGPTYHKAANGRNQSSITKDSNGISKAYGTSYATANVMLAPGANTMSAAVYNGSYWKLTEINNPVTTGYGAMFRSASSGEGVIRYQNINGGWIKVEIECQSFCDAAKAGGHRAAETSDFYGYFYRVYTNPANPLTSTINSSGWIQRTWLYDASESSNGTCHFYAARHNAFGNMAPEDSTVAWNAPETTWQTKYDRAIIYVPDDAYFDLSCQGASDCRSYLELDKTIVSDTWRAPMAKIKILNVSPINANLVPTEWGGTMGNKPSPNTQVP